MKQRRCAAAWGRLALTLVLAAGGTAQETTHDTFVPIHGKAEDGTLKGVDAAQMSERRVIVENLGGSRGAPGLAVVGQVDGGLVGGRGGGAGGGGRRGVAADVAVLDREVAQRRLQQATAAALDAGRRYIDLYVGTGGRGA